MKKNLIALTVFVATNVFADFSGEYVKKNAVVDIKQQGSVVAFSINSSVGQNVCNLDGSALLIDANRAFFTPTEKTDMCVAALNFGGGSLKITTKDCGGYCGLNAAGSMDGVYQKKAMKK